MDLWVIRHGPAEKRGGGAKTDAHRALTVRGLRRVERLAQSLAAREIVFERLWFSPWRRAVETADALAPRVTGPLVVTPLLRQAPSAALLDSFELAHEAVVGHEPWLGELIGILAWGDPQAGEGLRLGKASVAHLRGQPHPGGMQLLALHPADAV